MKLTNFSRLCFGVLLAVITVIAVAPKASHASHLSYNETLRPGMIHPDVILLQTALRDLRLYDIAIDGNYGSGTQAAVIQYQITRNLDVDGVAGPETMSTLNLEIHETGVSEYAENNNPNTSGNNSTIASTCDSNNNGIVNLDDSNYDFTNNNVVDIQDYEYFNNVCGALAAGDGTSLSNTSTNTTNSVRDYVADPCDTNGDGFITSTDSAGDFNKDGIITSSDLIQFNRTCSSLTGSISAPTSNLFNTEAQTVREASDSAAIRCDVDGNGVVDREDAEEDFDQDGDTDAADVFKFNDACYSQIVNNNFNEEEDQVDAQQAAFEEEIL